MIFSRAEKKLGWWPKERLILVGLNKCLFFFVYVYLWERQSVSGEGAERERGRHRIWNKLQALSCQHRARCGPWTREQPDHDLGWSRMLNWLSHPGTAVPLLISWGTLVLRGGDDHHWMGKQSGLVTRVHAGALALPLSDNVTRAKLLRESGSPPGHHFYSILLTKVAWNSSRPEAL